MSYKVIRPFKDLTDPNKHDYALDETYPRDGHKPSEEFISGLLTGYNSAGSIFLMVADDEGTTEEVVETETDVETTEEVADDKPKRKRTIKTMEE